MNGLLWKDWKVSIRTQLHNYLSLAILWLIGLICTLYFDMSEILLTISITLIVVHIFYIGTDMFFSLSKEVKVKLWFHSPLSSKVLLASKFFISFINCLLSITACIFLYIIASLLVNEPVLQEKSFTDALALITTIMGMAIYLGLWAIYFWSLFAVANSKNLKIGRYGLNVLLLFLFISLHELFVTSPLFQYFQKFGSFKAVSIGTTVILNNEQYSEISLGVTMSTFSLPLLAVFTLVAIVIFFLSQQNIKKLEG